MKILLASDASNGSQQAIDQLLRLPLPADCELLILNVIEDPGFPPLEEPGQELALDEVRQLVVADAESLLLQARARFAETGWQVESHHMTGHSAQSIIETAEASAIDLIVLGAAHEPLPNRLGKTATAVLKHAPCSVFIARDNHREDAGQELQPLNILLAFDGSAPSCFAVNTLAELPLDDRVEITLMTVLTVATTFYRHDILERMSASWQSHKLAQEKALAKAGDTVRRATANVTTRMIDGGSDASDELLQATEILGADIVMAGHTGKNAVKRFLFGSVAWKLCLYAPCSVWIARN